MIRRYCSCGRGIGPRADRCATCNSREWRSRNRERANELSSAYRKKKRAEKNKRLEPLGKPTSLPPPDLLAELKTYGLGRLYRWNPVK